MIQATKVTSLNGVVKMGGTPGFILIGYYLVHAVFDRPKTDPTAIDPSSLVFIAYSLLCFGVGWYYLFTKKDIRNHYESMLFFKTPLLWFILYTILGFISALWSLEYKLTIYRAFESMAMLLLIVATIKQLFKRGINTVIKWTIYYVFITVVIRFIQYYFQGAGIDDSAEGGSIFRSSQMISTIFFFLAIFHARKGYMRWTIIVIAILSISTTGYIGMAVGLISLYFGNVKYKIFGLIFGLAIIFTVSFVGLKPFLKNTVFSQRADVSLENSSGRNIIWEDGYNWFKQKPFTGYGFVAGETFLVQGKSDNISIIGMHNSFMSALVDEGVFGFLFLLFFFIGMFAITFSRYIPVTYRPALIASFLASFVHSMGNPGIGFRVYGSWMSAMYVCVLILSIYVHGKYYRRRIPVKVIIDQTKKENN
jgi:O-antigen ligase